MRRLLPARAWPGIAVVGIGLTALLLVLVVDAPSEVPEAAPELAPEASLEMGSALYAAHCAVCHGVGLEGGVGPALSEAGLHHRHPTALDLYEFIKDRMPVDGVGPGGWRIPSIWP